ncbi:bifunctional metallophosphatase/5'-nucleotidase [Nicoliella spurrieriana]|uniref:Bifunctional metallophosphatase/5'-nucleotidase n=1 Tax=Nicoliella spurrieriana TaxID=2925830 RepID=A0A976RS91_9LACO|nr:bifunctional metallophosphatase/5'-nucleotidase [Nicoliella spurrieriana]UQS86858.1 bifunctional metallophosphatase/5'-nucleotidase [Nicoliella spurrieriana]
MVKIKILSTSDVHGYLFPTNFSGVNDQQPFGYLRAASVIKQIRAANPDEIVLFIENGDFIEGSPLTSYAFNTHDTEHLNQKLCEMVNDVKPNAMVLGNHEFNYGVDYIADTWQHRNFPILDANITGPNHSKMIDAPYQIIESHGVKIGILGLTTQYVPNWEQPANIAGLKFQSAVQTAKHYVPILKSQADIVVVAYHGGFERDLDNGKPTEQLTGENEGDELLKAVDGIDALVTGHQHRELAQLVHGIPITQPGYRGANVGEIDLELDAQKQIVNRDAKLIKTANYPVDSKLSEVVNGLQATVEKWMDQPLATINGDMRITDYMDARLHGNAYLDLINKIQMDKMGVDISGTALFNDEITGFDRTVTIRNVVNSYVFPNTLVVEQLSGADLKFALEKCASFFTLHDDGRITVSKAFSQPKLQLFNYDYYSGIEYTFDLNQPVGQRVVKVIYHGKPLLDDQTIKVVMNQYRGTGTGGYDTFSTDKVIQSDSDDMPKLIMNYLKQHRTIDAHQPDNLHIIGIDHKKI